MDGTAMLFFGVMFSAIGMGYFVYGRRQDVAVALIAGPILIFFPFFMPNLLTMFVVGGILLALPFLIRI